MTKNQDLTIEKQENQLDEESYEPNQEIDWEQSDIF